MTERDRRIIENDNLAIHIARQYYGIWELDDLIAEGRMGLVEASDSYDSERGIPFSSWAGIHIKKNIRKFLSNHYNIVRVPPRHTQAIREIGEIESKLLHEKGFVDDREVVNRIKKSERFVRAVLTNPLSHHQYSDDILGGAKDKTWDNEPQKVQDIYNFILRLMGKILSNREYMCVVLRHVGGLSYEEISICTNISRSAVSSALSGAMIKIRAKKHIIEEEF